MNYFCCDQRRREELKHSTDFNGIDFLEVLEPATLRAPQTILLLHLFKAPASKLSVTNVRIDGGERIRGIKATKVAPRAGSAPNVLEVTVNGEGDFSIYTLRLVQGTDHNEAPERYDPLFATVRFSFRVGRQSEFDCLQKRVCPPRSEARPEIDYLAKDYATFRRLMLDRMAVLTPQWTERNPADLGIALVELLSYAADHLSYHQDAIATEAYLRTARRRISVRRHARLVDYYMHDGRNARAWVQVCVEGKKKTVVILRKGRRLLSRIDQQPPGIAPDSLPDALKQRPVVFETMHDALLFESHNALDFYAWGNNRCCLPRGATSATLLDDQKKRLRLCSGDVLVFEERVGPNSGREQDADPAHRHAVRLTRVTPEAERIVKDETEIDRKPRTIRFDKLPEPKVAIVEIEWALEDALPFALCISSLADREHGAKPIPRVSVARGNIVLCDHGLTVNDESLGKVPADRFYRQSESSDRCVERKRIAVPGRFSPSLQNSPLTYAACFDATAPATTAMLGAARDLLPAITLRGELDGDKKMWSPRRDLLGSGTKRHFVVEIESDGSPHIRFGDNENGLRPMPDTEFFADYRVGNGVAGNVGAEALCHIAWDAPNGLEVISVRNPMPAQGGVESESIEDVRQRAPSAFRTQRRAVTEADYSELVQRDRRVQRAAATFRWTGSWQTVFLTVDRFGGLPLDEDDFKKEIAAEVDEFRMAGHDFEIDGPRFVPLEVEMQVLAKPGYFRSEVKAALLELFNNRVSPDGRRGMFHPDNFTFGESVYLSPFYAAAYATTGVAAVQITQFKRRDSSDNSAVESGVLTFRHLEIARLDNDPNFAERGVFRLMVEGGK